MATYALTEANIWHDDVDLTAHTATVSVERSVDALDDTTFGDTYRSRIGGLGDFTLSLNGFVDNAAADPEDELQASVGTSTVLTVAPQGADADDWAYFGVYQPASLGLFGAIGDIASFVASGSGSNGFGLVAGHVNAAKASRNASSNSTGRVEGAVSAAERAYAALHIFSGTAGTLDVKVQSDDNAGFTSPTDRITFTQATGSGAQFSSVAGPITDTHWRVLWVVAGGGTWSFACTVGIQ